MPTQLNPTEAKLARAQLNASIQRWYRKNPQAVQNQHTHLFFICLLAAAILANEAGLKDLNNE